MLNGRILFADIFLVGPCSSTGFIVFNLINRVRPYFHFWHKPVLINHGELCTRITSFLKLDIVYLCLWDIVYFRYMLSGRENGVTSAKPLGDHVILAYPRGSVLLLLSLAQSQIVVKVADIYGC